MSTLTHLSDDELDAVTGGFLNTTIVSVFKVATNFNATSQSQLNVGILQAVASTGGGQVNGTSQIAVA
jgi:hypothetical protein